MEEFLDHNSILQSRRMLCLCTVWGTMCVTGYKQTRTGLTPLFYVWYDTAQWESADTIQITEQHHKTYEACWGPFKNLKILHLNWWINELKMWNWNMSLYLIDRFCIYISVSDRFTCFSQWFWPNKSIHVWEKAGLKAGVRPHYYAQLMNTEAPVLLVWLTGSFVKLSRKPMPMEIYQMLDGPRIPFRSFTWESWRTIKQARIAEHYNKPEHAQHQHVWAWCSG